MNRFTQSSRELHRFIAFALVLSAIVVAATAAFYASASLHASAAGTAHSKSAAKGGPWQLIYSDNFSGTQLNSTWGVYNGPHGGGQSYYSPGEVSVSNGMLHLKMEKKTTNSLPYTTGGVAAFRLAQTYGRYVFRAKLPLGKGVGPYTILWPNTPTTNVETDLFESPPPQKNELFFTNHGGPGGTTTQITTKGNFGTAFHVFDYQWTPGRISLTIDGKYIGSLTVDIPNQSMWFGMAISSGDAFTGLPDASTHLPVYFDIDWVHIYKYTG